MVRRTVTYALIATGLLAVAAVGTAYAASNEEYQAMREECKALKEAGDKEAAKECRKHAMRGLLMRRASERSTFTYENGTVEGRWVEFDVDAPRSIRNYSVSGGFATTTLFDSITLEGASATQDDVRGALYLAGERGNGFVAFNAPNAAWFAGSKTGGTLVVDVADGLTVTPIEGDDGAVRAVAIESGEHRGVLKLKGNATASVAGDVITIDLGEKGGAGFAIEGYPRILAHEKRMLHRAAGEHAKGRGAEHAAVDG